MRPSIPLRYTTFSHKHDNNPKVHRADSWEDFCQSFTLDVRDKKDGPLYCPALYVPGQRRTTENVIHIGFGVADIDSVGEEEVLEALSRLHAIGVAALLHTTHSHGAGLKEGKYKCRLCIPFSRPVEVGEWDRAWAGLNELLGGILDPQCKNPNRIYYFPSCPPGEEHLAEIEAMDGGPLNVDDLIEFAPEVKGKATIEPPDPEVLARIEKSVRFQHAKGFMEGYPVAVSGQGGNNHTYRAACIGLDFGLTSQEFLPILKEWNLGCKPPWTEAELADFLDHAEKYRTHPVGWRLISNTDEDDIVSKQEVQNLITDWISKGKNKKEKYKTMAKQGRVLRRMMLGEFGRTKDLIKLFEDGAEILAEQYTRVPATLLAEYFEEGIAAAHEIEKDVTSEMFIERVRDAQAKIHEREARARNESQLARTQRLKLGFQYAKMERDRPYEDDELKAFAASMRCNTVRDFDHYWVINYGPSYYLFCGGSYIGPFNREGVETAALSVLQPAQHLELYKITQQGLRPKNIRELMHDYGMVAREVIVDMTIQESYFDPVELKLHEASCPLRDLEPKPNEYVAKWLEKLAKKPKAHAKLLDWMACVAMIDKPCCALYLYGEKQTGKTLIAIGLSRLWRIEEGPTMLEQVSDNFNELLKLCPLVFGDEEPPRDAHGEPRTGWLRRMVQERVRPFNEKFKNKVMLKGCVRLVLCANNLDFLVPEKKGLTNHDIEALSERFLTVYVEDQEASQYLASLPKKARQEIMDGTAIAQHALWLAQNRKVKYGNRLLVEGIPKSELEMRLATSAGLRSEVCAWIARYIINPERMGATQDKSPLIKTGQDGRKRLLVTAEIMHAHWAVYCEFRPSIGKLQKALGGVCHEGRMEHEGEKYRIIDLDRVRYHAEENGIAGGERFDEALRKLGIGPLQVVT